jgi:hypothetical protein
METSVYNALLTVAAFVAVRHIVFESQDDLQPQPLPFCVFTMGERDYSPFETMCGVSPMNYVQSFDVSIYAETADECNQLSNSATQALRGIGVLKSMETIYAPELRCYTTQLTFD